MEITCGGQLETRPKSMNVTHGTSQEIQFTINDSWDFMGFLLMGNPRRQEKQLMGILLAGMGKVQIYRMS